MTIRCERRWITVVGCNALIGDGLTCANEYREPRGGYPDAITSAERLGWIHKTDGRDYCPEHAKERDGE